MSDESQYTGSEITAAESSSNLKFQTLDIIEIDLIEKAETIWKGRRTIMIFVAVCLALGFFHTEYGPTEYTSTSALIQESEGATVGDFGSSFLRSLTGINLPSGGAANMSAAATGRAPLPVSLYPRIVSSTEFQKELIYTELEFSKMNRKLTLYDYFHDHREPALRDKIYGLVGNMTIYLPKTVYSWVKGSFRSIGQSISGLWASDDAADTAEIETIEIEADERLQSISPKESTVIEWLRLRISLTSSGGIMEITASLPDPQAAALVNAKLVDYIRDYITNYRIEKAKHNLDDTLDRYHSAKERYEEAQYELAQFRDENINLSTNSARIEESRLNNEASLRFNIYNSVSQEVEQARMVLQQQIPVFNTLEKPNIPTIPSSGSSPLFLVFSGVLGFFGGIGWVLIRSSSIFK